MSITVASADLSTSERNYAEKERKKCQVFFEVKATSRRIFAALRGSKELSNREAFVGSFVAGPPDRTVLRGKREDKDLISFRRKLQIHRSRESLKKKECSIVNLVPTDDESYGAA